MKNAIRLLKKEIDLHKSTVKTWRDWGLKKGDLWEGDDAIGDKLKLIEELKKELATIQGKDLFSKEKSA